MTYVEYLQGLVPGWLRKLVGAAFLQAIGGEGDTIAAKAKDAVKTAFVLAAPTDSLGLHGRSRRLEQFPGESDAAYRARLARARDWWATAGTKEAPLPGGTGGIRGLLLAYLGVTVEVHPYIEPWRGPGWRTGWWSHFWVVLRGTSWTARDYGGGSQFGPATPGQPAPTWGSSATTTEVRAVKHAIAVFKAAHEVCPAVVVVASGRTWGSPAVYGGGATYDGSARPVIWPIP